MFIQAIYSFLTKKKKVLMHLMKEKLFLTAIFYNK